MQEHEGRFFPIAHGSKKLTSVERKYFTIEKECLAIVWGVSKFHLNLAGKPFVLRTDHPPHISKGCQISKRSIYAMSIGTTGVRLYREGHSWQRQCCGGLFKPLSD